MSEITERARLAPLVYHGEIAAWLREAEPEVWSWAASNPVQQRDAEDLRASMLRQTYRLEAEAHPEVHAACRQAMTALEIDAPVTLYQASDGHMNAALCYIPGEIHLVFYGPILERLTPAERLALMGHELAHYRLWAEEHGAFHTASRILDHAAAYASAAPAHFETARLFSLYTELYADRGAALAAGGAEPAIATLVKTMTGMPNVDPAAYLRQAAELEKDGVRSEGQTHPEVFLRAQALDRWWREDPGLEAWLESRIRGRLSIAALDLPGQRELMRLTRAFFAYFLADPSLRSDEVLTQVRRFFPDWSEAEDAEPAKALSPDKLDDSTREYLIALMFDCAMADREASHDLLAAAARTASVFGGLDQFRTGLKRDLKMTKVAIDKLVKAAEGRPR
jgi:hypothetical protein